MICPDLRCLVRRGEAASCQEPFESLRSLYLLICFSLHLTTFLPFLLLLLPLTSPSIFFLSPYLLLSTRDPLSIHYFLLPPPPPRLFLLPSFLLFLFSVVSLMCCQRGCLGDRLQKASPRQRIAVCGRRGVLSGEAGEGGGM